jgi:hypothetical protein
MKFETVKLSWLRLVDRIDAKFWIRVVEQLRERGLDPETATDEQVKQAIASLQ